MTVSLETSVRSLEQVCEPYDGYATDFLDHDIAVESERLMNFAMAHPWLVPFTDDLPNVDAFERIILTTADPDVAASRAMATTGRDTAAGFLPTVRRLRNFNQPEVMVGPEIARDVINARRLPLDLWPGPVPAGAPFEHPAQQTMTGFIRLAAFVADLAELSGRTPHDILGRVGDWGGYIERLRVRAGVEPMDAGRPDTAWCIVGDIVAAANDLIYAFEAEIVRPAVHRIDPTLITPQEYLARYATDHQVDRSLTGMAVRLLLRDGTLPKLLETSREWHGRSPAIAKRCALAAGGRLRAGPKLFDRIPLSDGTYLVCLNEPHELIAEGLRGPDPEGRPGLAHCVGSYIQRVSTGQSFIIGVRAPDPELGWRRIATVELGRVYRDGLPQVVQHKGRLNAEVPAREVAEFTAALPLVAANMRMRQGNPEDFEKLDWTSILAEEGSWEGLRDEWAFAIERGRRGLDHEEFLEGSWDEDHRSENSGQRT